MDNGALALLGGTIALILLSKRETEKARTTHDDREWMPALLSEYHPDAPEDQRELEGGKYDRNPRQKTLVITVQQHQKDPARYPYVSVAGDLVLRGKQVPYGTRIYFGSYPDLTFRLVDTGQRFYGVKKKIRKPGYEPFDIATNYRSKLGFAGKETVYRIDRRDNLPLRQTPNVA